jgi:hypothetical protein
LDPIVLEQFPLVVGKSHLIQLKVTIDNGEEAMDVAARIKAVG